MNLMNKKLVALISVLAVVLIITGVTGWTVYANNNEMESKVSEIQNDVNALYSSDKKMLDTDISKEKFDSLDSDLKKLEGEDMSQDTAGKLNTAIMELATAEDMFKLQEETNALLDQDGAIVENADIASAEKLATDLEKTKAEFVALQRVKIDDAKAQQQIIADATNAVNALFTTPERTEVSSTVSRDTYNSAKALVDSIKQASTKQALTGSLDQVNTKINEQEQAQAAAIAQAEVEEQAEANADASSNSDSSNNPNGSSGSSSSGSNDSGGSSSESGSSSSNSSSGSNSGSSSSSGSETWQSPEPQPGDTWDGETTDEGYINGDSGNSWGTIQW